MKAVLVCLLVVHCFSWRWFEKECQLDPAYEERMRMDLQQFQAGISQEMIDQAKLLIQLGTICLMTIKNGRLSTSCQDWSTWKSTMKCVFDQIATELPDMEFVINIGDNPIILKHECVQPFINYNQSCYCDENYIIPKHAYFFRPHDFKKHYYKKMPLFSPGTISECHKDILIPSYHHFYHSARFKAKVSSVPWQERQFKAVWRGSLSDAILTNASQNFTDSSHRLFFVDYCNKIRDCDAKIINHYTRPPDVIARLKRQYPLGDFIQPKQQLHYKILVDIDGASYSERFHRILKQGSAVFKIAAFDDIGTIAVRPWQHYVPIKMDLSDLEQKMEWARTHDQELQKIAIRGMQQSYKVHTFTVYKCYLKRLLIKYHELVQRGKKNSKS